MTGKVGLLELRVQHRVEVLGGDARDRLFLGDLPAALLVDHVDGHAQRGGAGALADAGLQHAELALVDRELGVAHVLVVLLEPLEDRQQFLVDLRELGGHRAQRFGVADAGDDVFTLRVDEEVAVRAGAHPSPGRA